MIYKLEDRVLFDAALPVDIVDAAEPVTNEVVEAEAEQDTAVFDMADPQAPSNDGETHQTEAQETLAEALDAITDYSAQQNNNELYIIDTSVPDYQTLIEQIPHGAQVELISPDENGSSSVFSQNSLGAQSELESSPAMFGLSSLSSILEDYTNLDAIHILSHGSDGSITLGGETISADNLSLYSAELDAIGESLSADGDILLYGCNVAESETGEAFVEQIAHLTNADVAASDDNTGSGNFFGDWDLEFAVGTVESDALVVENDVYQRIMGAVITNDVDNNGFVGAGDGNGDVTLADGNTFTFDFSEDVDADSQHRVEKAFKLSADYDSDLSFSWTDNQTLVVGTDGGGDGDGVVFDKDVITHVSDANGANTSTLTLVDTDGDVITLSATDNTRGDLGTAIGLVDSADDIILYAHDFGDQTISFGSEIGIIKSLTIVSGINDITYHGGGGHRFFTLSSTSDLNLTLDGFTLSNGSGDSGGAIDQDKHNSISPHTNVTIIDCSFESNSATTGGSAINLRSSEATLTIMDSAFDNNSGSYAIYATIANVTIENSLFNNNAAGALSLAGGVHSISNSTFFDNGGDSTVYSTGDVAIDHCTFVASNTYTLHSNGGFVTMSNTIVQGTVRAKNTVNSLGYNIVQSTNWKANGAFDQTGDVKYSGADFDADVFGGAPTLNADGTVAIHSGSIAVDAANPATTLTHDQRGLEYQGAPDVGAYEVDKAPTVAITLDDTAFKIGETATVTFTFSEVPTGFTDGDITAANGVISGLVVDSSNPLVYTATFTPDTGVESNSNTISVSKEFKYADDSVMATVTGSSANYEIDTQAPTVTITLNDTALIIGDSATVTFAFSEAPVGFTADDITVENGTLSGIAVAGDPPVYTATFTPTADIEYATNVITVASGVATDVAGNTNVETDSANYAIDTYVEAGTVTVNTITADDVVNAAESATNITVTGTAGGGDISTGDTVGMTVNGTYYSDTVAGDGTWSVSIAGANLAADTEFTVSVSSSDAAGNTVASNVSSTHSVDTSAPTAPTVALQNDTGTAGDNKTNDSTLKVTGIESGASIEYSLDDSSWSSTAPVNSDFLEEGNTVYVRQVDAAGNESASTSFSFDLDTTAPDLSGGIELVNDSNDSSDKITTDSEIKFEYTETNSSSVTVTFDGAVDSVFNFDFNGATWDFDAANSTMGTAVGTPELTAGIDGDSGKLLLGLSSLTTNIADGSYIVKVDSVDEAGNSATQATLSNVVIDTTAPTATLNDVVDPTVGYSNDGTLTLTGMITDATVSDALGSGSITITDSSNNVEVNVAAITINADGSWSYDLSDLTDDSYTILMSATDAAGNTISSPVTGSFIVDSVAPGLPTTDGLSLAEVEVNEAATISGTGTDGEIVVIYVNNAEVGTVTVAGGTWSYDVDTSSSGSFSVQSALRDDAGNTGALTTSETLTVKQAPAVVVDTPSEAPASSDPVTTSSAPESPVDASGEETIIVKETSIDTDVELYTGEPESTEQTMEKVAQQISDTLSVTNPAPEVSVTVTAPAFADTFNSFESDASANADPANAESNSSTPFGQTPAPQLQPMTMDVFKQLDVDSSSSLSIEELNQLFENIDFNEADLNGDDLIDEDEFKKMLEQQSEDKNSVTMRTLMDSRHTLETAPKYAVAFQTPLERALEELVTFNA